MEGILLVDKPSDWTSFDVVNYVRKLVAEAENVKTKQVKVGHSGTLDPFATGLLILLIGKNYTKQADKFTNLNKTYEFEVTLGKNSSTGDIDGKIESVSDKMPSPEQINKSLKKFTGEIEQIPPAYSAIKVDGVRSYKLARSGQNISHKKRPVVINSLKLIKYNYPKLILRAEVSSGTYIRTLSEDIGENLGTGAYTTVLRRTAIGIYNVEDSNKVKELKPDKIAKLLVDAT